MNNLIKLQPKCKEEKNQNVIITLWNAFHNGKKS